MSILRITSSLLWNDIVQKARDTGRFQSISGLISTVVVESFTLDILGHDVTRS
jgi:hypothetical protein